jgi:hypothetical protein
MMQKEEEKNSEKKRGRRKEAHPLPDPSRPTFL